MLRKGWGLIPEYNAFQRGFIANASKNFSPTQPVGVVSAWLIAKDGEVCRPNSRKTDDMESVYGFLYSQSLPGVIKSLPRVGMRFKWHAL